MNEIILNDSEATQKESNRSEALYENTQSDQWEDRKSVTDIAEAEKLEALYPEEVEITEEPETTQKITEEPETTQKGEPSYTVQELSQLNQVSQTVQQINAAKQKLQLMEQAVEKAGGDVLRAVGGDRGEEVAVRADMRELTEFIQTATGGVQKFAQEYYAVAEKKHLDSSQAEMTNSVADLEHADNRQALAGWLLDQGLSVSDVSAISPKQAATAWKLMQKDKANEPTRKFKVPMMKSKMPKKEKFTNMSTEELFAANGMPRAATILYGLPERAKEIIRPQPKPDDRATILYGSAS